MSASAIDGPCVRHAPRTLRDPLGPRREWRQITDFGDRTTFIARRVSWSSDGRSILAAVGDGDSDIVLLDGLTNVGRKEK
jgi:hypothetical protein